MELLLRNVISVAARHNLYLNRAKCKLLVQNDVDAIVLFPDGTPVTKVDSFVYLGGFYSHTSKPNEAVTRAIRSCMTDLKRLKLLWRESRCSNAWKINVMNAVIRAKLMYGLETIELPYSRLKCLDAFFYKCLRHVLCLRPTYVDRANTNALRWF
eukprot:2547529-Amphidinium_carterae.2